MNLQLDIAAVIFICILIGGFLMYKHGEKVCSLQDAQDTTSIVVNKGEQNAQILADRPDVGGLKRMLNGSAY